MSVKLMGQVWSLDLDHPEQSVLLALADHADDDGTHCFPSVDYIAWKTGYSTRSVQRVLADLRQARLIIPVGRPPAPGRTQEYQVVLANGSLKPPFQPHDPLGRARANSREGTDANLAHDEYTDATPRPATDAMMASDRETDDNLAHDENTGAKPGSQRTPSRTPTDAKPGSQLTPSTTLTDDIAMSPQPSLTIKEPSDESPVEPPLPGARETKSLGSGETGRRRGSSQSSVFPGLTSKRVATTESTDIGPSPNPFRAYEQNIGPLTPMLSEKIKDAEERYGATNIQEAISIALVNNRRSWGYVEGILRKRASEGKGDASGSTAHDSNRKKYLEEYVRRRGRLPWVNEHDPESYADDRERDRERRRRDPPLDIDPEADQIWRRALDHLKEQVPKPTFETWLAHTHGVCYDDRRFVVDVPTPFAIAWLERRMYQDIQRVVEKLTGKLLDIQFQCSS